MNEEDYNEFLGGQVDDSENQEENEDQKKDTQENENPKTESLAYFEIKHDKEAKTYTMSEETFNKLMNRFLA